MTTEQLLAELDRRGLQVVLKEGTLVLRGPKHEATPSLLRVLGWHREAIRERLAAGGPREWMWAHGQMYREVQGEWRDDWLFGHPDRHPVGAWWWRHLGQSAWQPVPGRMPEGQPGQARAA